MTLVYSMKACAAAMAIAVTWLLETGDVGLALAAVPGLVVLWWVTRRYSARRRAQPGGRS